jgi:hypothetical protein
VIRLSPAGSRFAPTQSWEGSPIPRALCYACAMRFNHRFPALVLFIAPVLCCSPSGNGASAPEGRPPAPQSFVAFRFSTLIVDRLEVPVEPPYAAGSTRAGGLLSSSDPAIVEADASGMLVAHRNGVASIRARNGATLAVTVQAARSLQIEPAKLDLKLGSQQAVVVKADGQPVEPRAIRWLTEDPNVAVGFGAIIHAGRTPGAATLTAQIGDAKATLAVTVNGTDVALKIEPENLRMNVGAMQQLRVPDVYAGAAQWSTSNVKVLQHLQNGLYVARARGTVDACASALGAKSCAHVEVSR